MRMTSPKTAVALKKGGDALRDLWSLSSRHDSLP